MKFSVEVNLMEFTSFVASGQECPENQIKNPSWSLGVSNLIFHLSLCKGE